MSPAQPFKPACPHGHDTDGTCEMIRWLESYVARVARLEAALSYAQEHLTSEVHKQNTVRVAQGLAPEPWVPHDL